MSHNAYLPIMGWEKIMEESKNDMLSFDASDFQGVFESEGIDFSKLLDEALDEILEEWDSDENHK